MYINKLKSIIYSFIILIITFCFSFSLTFAAEKKFPDTCGNFSKSLVYEGGNSNLRYYHFDFNDIGVFFDFSFNENNYEILLKRNKDKYPIVRFSLIDESISPGTVIKSYRTSGGISYDLSTLKDTKIKEIFKYKNIATLGLLDGKTITIKPISYKLNNFDLYSFGLKSIQKIDSTNGLVEITFNSTTSSSRPDLKKIIIEKNKFIDEWYERICHEIDSIIEWPIEYFKFNEFKYDEDIRSGVNNKTKLNTPVLAFSTDRNELTIKRYEKGIAYFRQDFNFRRFPFDKQIIKFKINPGEISTKFSNENPQHNHPAVTFITPKASSFKNLINYKNDNYLKEWKVISVDIKSDLKVDKLSANQNNGKALNSYTNLLSIEIEVERHWEQYLFKIIIPVFLILSVAWFVLWIPTREFETRLTTSMVALLSLIAYNFVFADDVPKLNYLTALDKYILLSYIFCCIPTFMSIWFSRFISTNQKKATFINRKIRVWGIAFYLLASLWIFLPKQILI
jgi:hypothetical protein